MRALPDNPRIQCALITLIAVILATTTSLAITDEEIFRAFPFNLQNFGARAMAIGGAFISLADDSTAAQANPAGLTQLRNPELFAELRASGLEPFATRELWGSFAWFAARKPAVA